MSFKRLRSNLLAFLAAGLCLNAASPALPLAGVMENSNRQPMPVESTLPNGLKCVLIEDHSYPVVGCAVWYKCGARLEQPGLTGLSHIVEHLVFQDVGTYKNGALPVALARSGAIFNGYTSEDFTAFYEIIHPSKLDTAIQAEALRMHSATFKPADLRDELAHIQREINDDHRDPFERLLTEIRATAYRQHPYKNPISGWPSDVSNITIQDAKSFYEKYYAPNNATLVLIGDFAAADAQALIAQHFGALPKSPGIPTAQNIVETAQTSERRVNLKDRNIKNDLCIISYHAPEYDSTDAPVMVLIEKLMNAQISGKLRKSLVEPKLCSAAKSEFELKKDPGLFSVYLTAAPGVTAEETIKAWDATANLMKAQLPSDAELRRARNLAEYALVNDRDGAYRLTFQLGLCDTLESWQSAYSWPDRLKSVTAADIQRAARKYLNSENRTIGVMSNPSVAHAARSTSSESPKQEKNATTETHTLKTVSEKNEVVSDKESAPKKGKDAKKPTDKSKNEKVDKNKAADKKDKSSGKSSKAKNKDTDSQTSSKKKRRAKKRKVAENEGADGSAWNNKHPLNQAMLFAVPELWTFQPTGAIPRHISDFESSPAEDTVPAVLNDTQTDKPDSSVTLAEDTAPGAANGIPPSGSSQNSGATNSLTNGSSTSTAAEQTPETVRKNGGASTAYKIPALPLKQRQLPNGMKVITYESHLSPIVEIVGTIKAGTALEDKNKRGVATLLTACFNSGSGRRDRHNIAVQQEDLGLPGSAMLHFEVSDQAIIFKARCLARDLQQELSLLRDALSSPRIAEDSFSQAKSDAIGYTRSRSNTLLKRVEDTVLRSIIATNSPYFPGDLVETEKSIQSLTPDDVKQFWSQYVAPDSVTLCLTGDVEPEAGAKIVSSSFAGWSRSGQFKNGNIPSLQPNSRNILKASIPVHNEQTNYVAVGKILPFTKSDPRYVYLTIAECALLNHPLIGRLVLRLGADPTLARTLESEEFGVRAMPLGNSTAWAMMLPVEPSAVSKLANATQIELKGFAQSGLKNSELIETTQYLLTAIPVHNLSNTTCVAKECLSAALASAPVDTIGSQFGVLTNTNLEMINKFIIDEFKPSLATLVVAGNRDASRNIRAAASSERKQ